jgi:hypothetical protein
VIFCTGDLNVAGTLTMTAKGGGVGNKGTEFNYNIPDTSLSFNTSSNWWNQVFKVGTFPLVEAYGILNIQTVPLRNPVAVTVAPGAGTAGVFLVVGVEVVVSEEALARLVLLLEVLEMVVMDLYLLEVVEVVEVVRHSVARVRCAWLVPSATGEIGWFRWFCHIRWTWCRWWWWVVQVDLRR